MIEIVDGLYIDEKMYCIICDHSAVVIDAVINEDFIKQLKKKNINDVTIILTHEHIDHIYGVNRIREEFDCKVICSNICAERIELPRKNFSYYKDVLFNGKADAISINYYCSADIRFTGEYIFDWQGHSFRMNETPGHSDGSICILMDNKYLFTGDSYIKGQKTITKLPGGSKDKFVNIAIPILMSYPKDCVVYPGHGECINYSDINFSEIY